MSTKQLTPDEKLLTWLDAASSIYNAVPLNPTAKQVWLNRMSVYSDQQIDQAFQHHLDSSGAMPKPVDIKNLIDGSAKEKALAAWTKVVGAMSDVGDHRSICFDDPLIHLVIVDMGGWTLLSRTADDKLSFAGHEFQKRYLTLFNQPKETLPPCPRSLAGQLAINNSGRDTPPPEEVVMYGDEDLTEMLFNGGVGQGQAVLLHRKPSVVSLGYTPSESTGNVKQLSY